MNPLILIVSLVHIAIAAGLIVFVLLHSGKGTGLSSMLGGVMSQAGASTGIIERNLDRITIGLAIAFTVTSLILAYGYHSQAVQGTTTPSSQSVPATGTAPSSTTTP